MSLGNISQDENDEPMQRCRRCCETLPLWSFHFAPSNRSRRQHVCKKCVSFRAKHDYRDKVERSLKLITIFVDGKWVERLAREVHPLDNYSGVCVRYPKDRRWYWHYAPATAVTACGYCRRIKRAHDCRYVDLRPMPRDKGHYGKSHHICIGCMGRFKALNDKIADLYMIRTLLGQIDREISNVRKNQNNRRVA